MELRDLSGGGFRESQGSIKAPRFTNNVTLRLLVHAANTEPFLFCPYKKELHANEFDEADIVVIVHKDVCHDPRSESFSLIRFSTSIASSR